MFSDFEVIHTYSRAEAIADGVLINLSSIFPEESRLLKYPVACTSAVWSLIETAASSPKHCNSAAGVVWDVLYMAINGITNRISDSEHLYEVVIAGAGKQEVYTLKANCGPNDDGSPCITIMLENED